MDVSIVGAASSGVVGALMPSPGIWYVSSAAYGVISAFAINTVYAVGDIVKPTAPAIGAKWVYRVTKQGTSNAATEPTWPTANNSTVVSGTVTFANITGQSSYAWAAAAGDTGTIDGAVGAVRQVAGDIVYVSSDHSETWTSAHSLASVSGYIPVRYYCVNRGSGNIPPPNTDITTGASIATSSGALTLNRTGYWNGFSFTSASHIYLESSTAYGPRLDNCALFLNNATTTSRIAGNSASFTTRWNNTTVQFGNASQGISSNGSEILWYNTPTAIKGATLPTTLFIGGTSLLVTMRGVDISALVGTLTASVTGTTMQNRVLLEGCRIASALTRLAAAPLNYGCAVELINCYDGTNIVNERYIAAGTVMTERTITLSGGATDDIGTFSLKMISGTTLDKWTQPLETFWFDVENKSTGSPVTATVEIISSGTLKSDEIALHVEYQNTLGSPVTTFVNNFTLVTPSSVASIVTASSATWNSSPSTPVTQKLQVTFTPANAGRVRGVIRLGKVSTTAYINPQLSIA